MTNFDYLKNDKKFEDFAETAIVAEKVLHIDARSCIINCRRAMEFAVKFMYSVDAALVMPYNDKLVSLMSDEDFKDIVGNDVWKRMDFIRKIGNTSAHTNKKFSIEQAELCLENLFIFLDLVAYFYAENYSEREFDKSLLYTHNEPETKPDIDKNVDLQKLIEENKALKEQLTQQRKEQQKTYSPKPLDLTEYETRKVYIDYMLENAGWSEGINWINEFEVDGMPNDSGKGYVDYVMMGDNGKPLAILEAKRTCKDVAEGRMQAKLYADSLEKKYGQRPVIFLSNGFDTRIIDNVYPERKVATVYSKRDLEKTINLQKMRTSLSDVSVNQDIAGRYYQEAAIKSVCDSFDKKNRRKALLVMATGSGKTRTIIALCDILKNHGWVKNILFLADRTSLVTQAKRSFVNLLPTLTVTNLCEPKPNYNARCVLSTYQTMMHCIDKVEDEQGKIFTSGHFDLVICDEAHRSIYNKYRDIFNYFDSHLVGLTATPKDEIDKNTYEVFELESGVPTYGYELSQAVTDGYLVDYMSVETKLKFIEQGIVYDELSDEDKEEYEKTFSKDSNIPDMIDSSALNEWVFNEDTIREVLHTLMQNGLKVDYGEKIGKTIIFAKNHKHAEKIFEVFNKEYPYLKDYAMVIDNALKFSQAAIDAFSDIKKLPQIAISVDMLDTGIDVPEILNLVFFKKVRSKAKFWQMIGRGTRKCDGLVDGKDKDKFYIFHFCGNFEFFRLSDSKPTANMIALQGGIFKLKTEIVYKLQDIVYQTPQLVEFRDSLVEDLVTKVNELNRDSFYVRQHLKYVDTYSTKEAFQALTYEDTLSIAEELVPLIIPDKDDPKAIRFDALIYGIELAYLAGKTFNRHKKDLYKKVLAVSRVANIPEIMAQSTFITKLLNTDYVETAGINEFEQIRENIRNLIKYIPVETVTYATNFSDEILSQEWNESDLKSDDSLKNYREKVEYYIKQHQDNLVISKLKSNQPLTQSDLDELEKILWKELGTKEDYESEYNDKPLGIFVREIVGLDMNAAKNAFSEFLNDNSLDSRQIYFVNQIIEYIVHNGILQDLSVLQEAPFTDRGSIVEVFSDFRIWQGIKKIIDKINSNAIA